MRRRHRNPPQSMRDWDLPYHNEPHIWMDGRRDVVLGRPRRIGRGSAGRSIQQVVRQIIGRS